MEDKSKLNVEKAQDSQILFGLEKKEAKREKELGDLRSELEALRIELEKLKDRNSKLNEELTKKNKLLEDKNATLGKKAFLIRNLENSAKDKEKEIQNFKKTIQTLESDKKSLNQENQQLRNQTTKVLDKSTTLQREVKSLKEEIIQLKNDLTQVNTEKSQWLKEKQRIGYLQQSHSTLRSELEQLKDERSHLRSELGQGEGERSRLRSELEQLKDERSRLSEENRHFIHSVQNLEQSLRAIQNKKPLAERVYVSGKHSDTLVMMIEDFDIFKVCKSSNLLRGYFGQDEVIVRKISIKSETRFDRECVANKNVKGCKYMVYEKFKVKGESHFYIVQEKYGPNLTEVDLKSFSVKQKADLSKQMIDMLVQLEKLEISHNDISEKHLVFSQDKTRLVLINFEKASTKEQNDCGPNDRRLPEFKADNLAQVNNDIYSMGSAMLHLWTETKYDSLPTGDKEVVELFKHLARHMMTKKISSAKSFHYFPCFWDEVRAVRFYQCLSKLSERVQLLAYGLNGIHNNFREKFDINLVKHMDDFRGKDYPNTALFFVRWFRNLTEHIVVIRTETLIQDSLYNLLRKGVTKYHDLEIFDLSLTHFDNVMINSVWPN